MFSSWVLEAGGTIFLAKEPCLQCFELFGSKRNPSDFNRVLF